ncbi:MAG: tetratricopeptide repeat protein [bacterium]
MKRRHLLLLTLILAAVLSAFLFAERGMTESRSVILKYKGEDGRVREDKLYSGSFALLIGASRYRAGLQDLPGVKGDIADMEKALKDQGFTIVTVMDPDREHLLGAIDDFINKYGRDAENRLLIYFAGHGCTLKLKYGGDMGFIAPVGAPDPRLNEAGFKAKAVDMQKFESFAKTIDSKHVLFVFDSCFSGSVFEIVNRDVPEAISYKTERPVRQFMTAGSADEEVSDKSDFKREFIEGIKGEADSDHDGYVTATELGVYLNSKVAKYSKGCQHPQFGTIRDPVLDKGDFVFDYGKPQAPAYEPNLPPKAGLDMSGLDNEAQNNREARDKERLAWVEWQDNLSRDAEKLKEKEANPDISLSSKKQAWEKFLETYGQDNPYSKEDENLRQYAEGRISALDQKVAEEVRRAEEKHQAEEAQNPRKEAPKADAFLTMGKLYANEGRYRKAIDSYKQTIEIKPDHAEAYLYLGIAYNEIGYKSEAVMAFNKVIQLNPNSAVAHMNLGIVYLSMGNEEGTQKEYEALRKIDNELAEKLLLLINKQFHSF